MAGEDDLITNPQVELTSKMAYAYFLLQGCGTLITWNAVLNGLDYFKGQFPEYDAFFLFPIAIFISQGIANIFMVKLSNMFTVTYRVIAALLILSVILAILPIFAELMKGTDYGFWIIMFILLIMGFFSTVYQSTISGVASFFPFKFTSLYLVGSGLAGLIMNALRAIAILAFKGDEGTTTFQIVFYFIFASLIMITCMFIHIMFSRGDYYRAHCKFVKTEAKAKVHEENDVLTLDGELGRNTPLVDSEVATEAPPSMFGVLSQVRFFVLCLLINYIQSFTFFPGVMLQRNTGMPIHWKMVSMFTVFNVFDIVGKSVAERPTFCKDKVVLIMTISRCLFAGTFIAQALSDNIPVISSLAFGFINIALFAFTNGFVTTACFILGPSKVEGKSKEVAGFLSVIGLTTGITIGTFVALAFKNLHPDAK